MKYGSIEFRFQVIERVCELYREGRWSASNALDIIRKESKGIKRLLRRLE